MEKLRVLLVENEPKSRARIARALHEAGFAVIEAAGGIDALLASARQNRPFDLLLIKTNLPAISGPRLAAKFAHPFPALPVVHFADAVPNLEALVAEVREALMAPRKQPASAGPSEQDQARSA